MTYKLEYEINFGLQLIVMLYSLFSNSFLYEICHDIAAIFGDIEHKHTSQTKYSPMRFIPTHYTVILSNALVFTYFAFA